MTGRDAECRVALEDAFAAKTDRVTWVHLVEALTISMSDIADAIQGHGQAVRQAASELTETLDLGVRNINIYEGLIALAESLKSLSWLSDIPEAIEKASQGLSQALYDGLTERHQDGSGDSG